MASIDESLQELMAMPGSLGAAVVDYSSGMTLGTAGGGPQLDLEVAGAGNTEVVRAKMNTMQQLGLQGNIEDILITLDRQYHLIRPVTGQGGQGLFVYLALDKSNANLAMARRTLENVEHSLNV
jgi:hypothetical protein